MCVFECSVYMYICAYVCLCVVGRVDIHLLVLREGLQPLQQRTRDLGIQVLSDGGPVRRRLGRHGEALVRVLRRGARRVALRRAIGGGGGASYRRSVAQRRRRAGAGGRRRARRVGGRDGGWGLRRFVGMSVFNV